MGLTRNHPAAVVIKRPPAWPDRPLSGLRRPPADRDEALRLARGRDRLNSIRRLRADMRRVRLAKMLLGYDIGTRPTQAALGRALGVSQPTISNDLRMLALAAADEQRRKQARRRRSSTKDSTGPTGRARPTWPTENDAG